MSANVAAVCSSYKQELQEAIHNLTTGTGDALKAALYLENSGIGPATTVYSATGEVVGTGYTAGGKAITNGVSPLLSGITAYWTPSASVVWTGLTLSSLFDCCLLYNSSKANRAVAVITFPAQTVPVGGNFTLTFPANAPTTALLQTS